MKAILAVLFSTISWKGVFMTKDQKLPLVTRILRWWLLGVTMMGSSLVLIDYANTIFRWW